MRTSAAIWLDRTSNQSLQNQVACHMKGLIQNGQLQVGEPLPSSRELAEQLKVSRNTVVYAYDQLMSEGYLETKQRSGVFVSSSIAAMAAPHLGQKRTQPASHRVEALQSTMLRLPAPFRPCQPDVGLFPLKIWNRLRSQALRKQGSLLLHYQESCRMGLPTLRQVLASYLQENRGVNCDWRQIAITTGSQQALYLLSRVLLKPGDRVYMEDPGYPGAQLAWADAGAAVHPGKLDKEGLRLPASGKRNYVLIYTTPSRQFPTGVCLALPRRLALLAYASKHSTWIIEDDYDAEFRYAAPPLPSLQSLDRAGRVIYVGTFSKVLCPSLRLGYVVLPPELVETFERRRALLDDHGPIVDQAALAALIESGTFYSHIRRCRRAYAERQSAFLRHARKIELPLEFSYTDGGMNLTGLLQPGANDKRWSAKCKAVGLDVPPLSQYGLQSTPPGLVFGFTAFEPLEIEKGLNKLNQTITRDPQWPD